MFPVMDQINSIGIINPSCSQAVCSLPSIQNASGYHTCVYKWLCTCSSMYTHILFMCIHRQDKSFSMFFLLCFPTPFRHPKHNGDPQRDTNCFVLNQRAGKAFVLVKYILIYIYTYIHTYIKYEYEYGYEWIWYKDLHRQIGSNRSRFLTSLKLSQDSATHCNIAKAAGQRPWRISHKMGTYELTRVVHHLLCIYMGGSSRQSQRYHVAISCLKSHWKVSIPETSAESPMPSTPALWSNTKSLAKAVQRSAPGGVMAEELPKMVTGITVELRVSGC